jgi:predicted porin
MKKTLVALAALAVAGGAFAQSVTLTGKLGYAYTDNSTATGVKSNGFGMTDGNVTFKAVEDLGGGLKAGVSMDVRVRGRAAAGSVDGRDASIFVGGAFGTVSMGAVEAGNGIIGLASADAPTIGQDGGVTLDAAANVDYIGYYSPNMGGFTAKIVLTDSIGAPGTAGLESTSPMLDATTLGVAYATGPVSVAADYTSFGLNAVPASVDKRTRISGSYDLGVVKLGAGYQDKSYTAGATALDNKQYMLGMSAPIGAALTVGATYARKSMNNVSGMDAKGYELGAQYNLSKRTNVQVAYLNTKVENQPESATTTRIRLMHAF